MLTKIQSLIAVLAVVTASACANPSYPGPSDSGGTDPGAGETDPVPSRATTNLRVVNYTDTTVYYLYVSPSSSSSWGSDQLGSRVITPGSSFTLSGIPCGINYDVKAEASGHRRMATFYGSHFSCSTDMVLTLGGG